MKPIQFDELITFLIGLGLDISNEQEDGKFNRNIIVTTQFGQFNIEWYKNQSTISDLGGNFAYTFRYIYNDTTFPRQGNWIGFSPTKNKTESIFHREYPYEIFRLKY